MTKEELDAIRERVSFNDVSIHDVIPLLAEVERLTADPLPAAAWVREVERAAFRRGVAAMRAAAASCLYRLLTERKATAIWVSPDDLRALPDPEDK